MALPLLLGLGVGGGLLASGAGAAMSANAASNAQRQAMDAANTPGISIDEMLRESARLAPESRRLEQERNTYNQAQLQALIEQSIPGYTEAQRLRAQDALALIRGELPADEISASYRSGAGAALEGGYAGSPAMINRQLRDLNLGTLKAKQLGSQQLSQILGSTPMAPMQSYEFGPQGLASLRGQERAQRMAALTGVANMPSAGSVFGGALGSLGSGLTNLGFATLGSGTGTGGEGSGAALQRRLMGGP